MKKRIKKVVEHDVFYWLVITCVFLNTISVAAEYYMQPRWLTDLQGNNVNCILKVFFFKIILNISIFIRGNENFDFSIILL